MDRLAWIPTAALLACSGPPGSFTDAGPTAFDWRIDLGDLDEALLSVWVAPDGSQAVAVGGRGGDGVVLEWDGGQTWRAPLLPDGSALLWWTWGDGDAVFAVGEGATVLRRGGGVWRSEPIAGLVSPSITFYGVWGSSEHDVWVVGGTLLPGPAAILHWDGLSWSVEDPGERAQLLFKVWGTGPGDVWAVGTNGDIVRRGADGVWRDVDSGTSERLIAVMGRGPDEVYAVGGDGAGLVLAWDGAAWSPFATAPEPLSAIWTAPRRALFVGGNRGLLTRYGASDDADPAVADERSVRPAADVDFHCLGGGGGRLLAVGADILGGGGGHWGGAIASHGGVTAQSIEYAPEPDAGPPDASPPDASPIDGEPPDARWPSYGEACGFTDAGLPICAAGLECWLLATSGTYLCTQPCESTAECGEYGPSPCCRRPGFQTLTTVCIPEGYVECSL